MQMYYVVEDAPRAADYLYCSPNEADAVEWRDTYAPDAEVTQEV
jgi:hypothetical protein